MWLESGCLRLKELLLELANHIVLAGHNDNESWMGCCWCSRLSVWFLNKSMSENFLAAHNIQGLAFFFFKQELDNQPCYNPLFSTLTKAMLGKPVFSKMNEFTENFRTAFDSAPPSEIFRKFIHFWKDGLPNPHIWLLTKICGQTRTSFELSIFTKFNVS